MSTRFIMLTLCLCLAAAAQSPEEQFEFAEHLQANGEDGFAMLEFKRFVFHHPDHDKVPAAFRNLASLYISYQNDIGGARQILEALIARYPKTTQAEKAKAFLDFVEVNSDFGGNPLKLWMDAENLEKQKRYDLALQKLNTLLQDYPKARLADNAWYRKGLLLRDHLGKPAEAHAQFAQLPSRYSDSELRVDAQYEAANTLAAMKDNKADAANALRSFAKAHPKDPRADKALKQADALDKETFKLARRFDKEFVKNYSVKETTTEGGTLKVVIETPVGLSQREVKATLEDALIKESDRRKAPRDPVTVAAYINYPISRAGTVRWTPGQEPSYDVEKQETGDVIRDVFIDILKGR